MSHGIDWAAAGLLEGLEPDEQAARVRLLERLHAEGVTPQELTAAAAEDRLVLLPIDRVLGGGLTARQVEERTNIPAELLLQLRRLNGLSDATPEDPVFSEADVAANEKLRLFLDAGLPVESVTGIARVLGESMRRVTDTIAATFTETFLRPGQPEDELAAMFSGLAGELAPAFEPLLTAAYVSHLRESVRRGVLGREERIAGQRRTGTPMAVCFADLVGFTRLGWESDPEELGAVAERLAEAAVEVARGPVQLVKTIGDAAMFTSPSAAPLVAAALELVEMSGEGRRLPALRAGIAYGPATTLAGDVFGNTVNIASRVTGFARPGSVLATQAAHDAAADAFRWSFAGRHRLRGVAEPQALHRARPPRTADAD